ncbi:MAG: WecB/TagA/CpsF family glycosyltransferase [Deltaproteobacteria bacterium]|nr:WecB/TagA/CpsF family glycosyltransferase [Deltaproteobacteria bacterium]
MTETMSIVLSLLALALLLPAVILFIECFLALFPPRSRDILQADRPPRVAVLIPAHDEEQMIGATVATIVSQLSPDDRVLVVADNCADRTGELARAAGADVISRKVESQQGKGYALAFGLRALSQDPPEVVVMVDADCTVGPNSIPGMADLSMRLGRPVQARYVMDIPHERDPLAVVSAFAFLVRNVVRPSGLDRLGLPCLLTGSGMAFPWPVIAAAPIRGESLVEDMQLGLDLAVAGCPPAFCAAAEVRSRLPEQRRAQTGQRRRWEHGHLAVWLNELPRLLRAALRQRRPDLLALALDLSVPPLSLLVLLGTAAMGAALAAGTWGGSWVPSGILAAAGLLVAAAIGAAWTGHARGRVPLSMLLLAPFYVLWKAPLYVEFLFRRQKAWVRTERGTGREAPAPTPDGASPPEIPCIRLRGVRIHALTQARCAEHVFRSLETGQGGWVATVNVDHLRRITRSSDFAVLCASASLAVADGMPLVWASRLQGTPLPGRVPGSDLLGCLAEEAAAQGRSVFLLGGDPGTGEASAEFLRRRIPRIRIAGTHCPPRGFEQDARAMAALTEALRDAAPDIVFVALGSPKQEALIARLRASFPRCWWLPVGISFSFLAGEVRRAPRWVQRLGLEWLHRLVQEPRRLARRYLVEDLPFALLLLAGAARLGVAKRLRGHGMKVC